MRSESRRTARAEPGKSRNFRVQSSVVEFVVNVIGYGGGKCALRQRKPVVKQMDLNASETIDNLIADLKDWLGMTLAQIRKIIRKADPDIIEEWKWMGSPVWSHEGMVCLVVICKDKVKLTFYEGMHLADPDKLFNAGMGSKWRTIDFHKDDPIREQPMEALIKTAIEFNHGKVKSKVKVRRSEPDAGIQKCER